MAEFPVRGQKAPDYWDVVLKDYIDAIGAEQMADSASDLAAATDARINDAIVTERAKAIGAAAGLAIVFGS